MSRDCSGKGSGRPEATMQGKPYDPRGVANLMLNEAQRLEIDVTNLALQKLLYFAHGLFLINHKRPLVSGYFEAWEHGPVHPTVYQAFKEAGGRPITFRATSQNILTGHSHTIPLPVEIPVRLLIQHILGSFGRLSPGRLVDISHAKAAPWDFIVNKSRTSVAFGLRIPDNVIVDRFRYHKVSIGDTPRVGEPSEDTPLA